MKLYKFRSLADAVSLERAEGILDSGLFWCSRFWELNDPMEGVYRVHTSPPNVSEIFSGKADRVICAFSGGRTLRNSLMWGYYSNGFKGIAIEIEVPEDDVREMRYTDDVVSPDATQPADAQVETILSNKLKPWKHEAEYRFITRSRENLHSIGRITAVVIGTPYPRSLGYHDYDGRMTQLDAYRERVHRLADIARRKAIRVDLASMRDAQVQVDEEGDLDAWGAR